jgi:hypothetical protein
VEQQQKRPKITLILAKTTKVIYGLKKYIKTISIPLFYDLYNYNINIMNKANQLVTNNTGLCKYRRGGWQALKHWLLYVVLYNYFILVLWKNFNNNYPINFRF